MTDRRKEIQDLFDNTDKRVLSQRIKSKRYKHLWEWVLDQTDHISDISTAQERVYLALNPDINPICQYNNRKKYVAKSGRLGFCGKINSCQCFREFSSEQSKLSTVFGTEEFLKDRKEKWIEKYGETNPSKTKEVKEKRKNTIAKRIVKDPIRYKHDHIKIKEQGFEQVIKRVSSHVAPCFDYSDYNGCFRKNHYKWKCVTCENEFNDHVDYGRIPVCKICYPEFISSGEVELREFLNGLGVNFETNVRNIISLELDIYIPEYNAAIEYNGVYWHSDKHKDKNYHVNKHIECRDKGIKLIHVFEDQWQSKRDIVKCRLMSILGKSDVTYARKCIIKELDATEAKSFINKYHIQGWASASISLGLYYNDVLVAVMSFGKNRYHVSDDTNSFELIRYCSEGRVVGGASKILSYFIKNYRPTEIISYADRCWSDGNLYRKIGFTDVTIEDKNTGYFYVKDLKRYHRSSFTKSKLVEMGYNSSETETQIMDKLGYLKIYDCGNYKFQMLLDNYVKT